MNKPQHQWSYKQQGSEITIGPVEESKFVALVKNGTIHGHTLVSSPTRTKNKWVSPKRIPALAKLIMPSSESVPSESDLMPPSKPMPSSSALTPAKVKNEAVAAPETDANPYAAPLSESAALEPPGKPKAALDIYKKFLPLNSTVVVWLLRSTMLALAINGLVIWYLYQSGRSGMRSIEMAQMGVYIIQLVLMIATAIFFLRWKYRAYANLQAACSSPLKTSAGWTCGCYFIPFVNLYRPVLDMHEIQSRSKASIGYSVFGWWFLWIVSSLLARAAWNTNGDYYDHRFVIVSIASICLVIMAGFLLLKIIRTVTEKQRRYRLSLEANST